MAENTDLTNIAALKRERPILMGAPMVRGLRAGTKTQTRRAVKPQPWASCCIEEGMEGEPPFVYSALGGDGPGHDVHETRSPCRCPYGQPGDRLWVRETFYAYGRWITQFNAKKGCDEWHFIDMTLECGKQYHYPVEDQTIIVGAKGRGGAVPMWWKRPAIFMPRAASRITLEITGVRVERLQDISNADAIAEGVAELVPVSKRAEGLTPAALAFAAAAAVESMPKLTRRGFLAGALASTLGFAASPSRPWEVAPARITRAPSARELYAVLWESINGVGSWDANPWVWVVEFKRLEP